jgi:hypothetical protein
MELTTTIACRCRVSAGLEEDGRLSVKVFGEAEYAEGRTTTAEVPGHEIADALKDKLAAVLGEILAAATPALGPRVAKAIHKSTEVAAAHGEI